MQIARKKPSPRSRALFAGVGMLALFVLGGLALWFGILGPRARQAAVAERGGP